MHIFGFKVHFSCISFRVGLVDRKAFASWELEEKEGYRRWGHIQRLMLVEVVMKLRNLEREVFGSSFKKQQARLQTYVLYLSCFTQKFYLLKYELVYLNCALTFKLLFF